MALRNLTVTGLDMGSSKMAAVAMLVGQSGSVNVVAHASVPSKGMAKGVFVNLDEAIESVTKVLSKLREKLGRRPENIFVNISGIGVRGQRSSGMTPLAARGREVTKFDIQRSIEAASTVTLPLDREVLHRIVHRFSVDGENFIADPIGLHAARLTCEVYLVSAPMNQVHDIQKCVNEAGYDAREVVFTGIADSCSILDQQDRKGCVMILDIGHSVTEACLFSEGVLKRIAVVPFGALNLKGGFREVPVIEEAMAAIGSDMRQARESGTQINSVIVTGGAAFTDGLIEFIEEKFSRPAKTGAIRDSVGNLTDIDNFRAITATGLARYGAGKLTGQKREFMTPIRRMSSKVVDLINSYF